MSNSTVRALALTAFKTSLLIGAGYSNAAFAQATVDAAPASTNAAPVTANGNDIVVTAQRREEKLQQVPISIGVLSGSALDKQSYTSTSDALRTVPGVVINTSNQGGGTTLSVRGVSAQNALFSGSSPIGYYIDSTPFGLVKSAVVPNFGDYDLDRIEVLRGPQGTLYGANALNGVVRILTKDPEFNRFELKTRASVSTTQGGAMSDRVDGAVNIPLVDDKLAVRAVVGYQDLGGWINDVNGHNINDDRMFTGRFKLAARPSDELRIDIGAMVSRDKMGAPSSSTYDNFSTSTLAYEPVTTNVTSVNGNVSYDFGSFAARSSTSYLKYHNESLIQSGQPLDTTLNADVFDEEAYLNSTGKGPWRWTLGGMYRSGHDTTIQNYGLYTPVVPLAWRDASTSYAAFGEITRLLFDNKVEITGGLRYFHDKVSTNELYDFGLDSGKPPQPLVSREDPFHKVTPRGVITYHPTRNWTTYVSYSEGFRSGAQQTPVTLLTAPSIGPLQADSLKNYEGGAKGDLFGGVLSFDVAVYYVDWSNIQRTLKVPYQATFVSADTNAKSASGVGYDLSATVKPMHGFSIGASYSRNYITLDAPVFNGTILVLAKGSPVGSKYTGSAFADYDFPIGNTGYDGRVGASVYGVGKQYYYTTTGMPGAGNNVTIGRVMAGLDAPERKWTATVFVDNVTNDRGVVTPNPTIDDQIHMRPRTAGIQFETHF